MPGRRRAPEPRDGQVALVRGRRQGAHDGGATRRGSARRQAHAELVRSCGRRLRVGATCATWRTCSRPCAAAWRSSAASPSSRARRRRWPSWRRRWSRRALRPELVDALEKSDATRAEETRDVLRVAGVPTAALEETYAEVRVITPLMREWRAFDDIVEQNVETSDAKSLVKAERFRRASQGSSAGRYFDGGGRPRRSLTRGSRSARSGANARRDAR